MSTNNKNPETNSNNQQNLVKVALAGNPNVGKSLFFNFLSGAYVDVSNFPGTTVDITKGIYKNKFEVFDTPGVYGLSSYNEEECVARDTILEADIIINVVNALHLDRDLFFTRQLIDLGKPIVVMLNFCDELKKRNIKIEIPKLAHLLGVDVYETAAVSKTGFSVLETAIENARSGKRLPEVDAVLTNYLPVARTTAEAVLLAEGDAVIAERLATKPGTVDDRETIYITRRNYVNEIVAEVEYEDSTKGRIFNTIGMLSLSPRTGIPILLLVCTFMYFFIGDLISQRLVNYTENTLGHRVFEYQLKKAVAAFTPVEVTLTPYDSEGNPGQQVIVKFSKNLYEDPYLYSVFDQLSKQEHITTEFHFPNPFVRFFFGEFGVISMTITYLVFLLLPLVIAFYFVMAFLEDSGYLPRLATMMDRSLTTIGLNGKAIIPILLGFGCVTMATITTRILGSSREKTIATAILQFVIPCSAQLAVITFLMSSAGFLPFVIYCTVIFTVLIALSTILNWYLPGNSSPLLLDLPLMQMPRMSNLLKKMYYRAFGFMKEAVVWFFLGAAIIGILEITGWLVSIQNVLAPITTQWLKLPKEASAAFVMGVVRRDFGTAGLFEMALSPYQKTVAIITITLFVPCIASAMVMLKERGLKEGLLIWAGTWIGAFTIGGIVAQIIL